VLRCPNCGCEREELLDQQAVDRLDEELDRGSRDLELALADMTRRNMREYAELFSCALAFDAILPEDF
jgi:hypothetical protein